MNRYMMSYDVTDKDGKVRRIIIVNAGIGAISGIIEAQRDLGVRHFTVSTQSGSYDQSIIDVMADVAKSTGAQVNTHKHQDFES